PPRKMSVVGPSSNGPPQPPQFSSGSTYPSRVQRAVGAVAAAVADVDADVVVVAVVVGLGCRGSTCLDAHAQTGADDRSKLLGPLGSLAPRSGPPLGSLGPSRVSSRGHDEQSASVPLGSRGGRLAAFLARFLTLFAQFLDLSPRLVQRQVI